MQQPKNIFEAAERGLSGYITRTVERAIEFNINIRVGVGTSDSVTTGWGPPWQLQRQHAVLGGTKIHSKAGKEPWTLADPGYGFGLSVGCWWECSFRHPHNARTRVEPRQAGG